MLEQIHIKMYDQNAQESCTRMGPQGGWYGARPSFRMLLGLKWHEEKTANAFWYRYLSTAWSRGT